MQTSHTQFITNPDKDETVIVHAERFAGLVDHCKALHNEGFHGSKEMRHVAAIPGILIEHYCFINHVSWDEFFSDPKHIKKLLNDPEFSAFRVAPGRV